jgi:hypothetical protein
VTPEELLPMAGPTFAGTPLQSSQAPRPDVRAVLAALLSNAPQEGREPAPRPRGRTLVVGDSLGVGTAPGLERRLGRVDVNARVGRPSAEGVQVLRDALARRDYGRIMLDLGTNDASAQQLAHSLRQAKRLAGDTPLFAATVRGPGAGAKNRLLRRSGVELVDWAGRSDRLVGGDGIHATAQGYDRRARMVARALRGRT